jgi:hypothetical protein
MPPAPVGLDVPTQMLDQSPAGPIWSALASLTQLHAATKVFPMFTEPQVDEPQHFSTQSAGPNGPP